MTITLPKFQPKLATALLAASVLMVGSATIPSHLYAQETTISPTINELGGNGLTAIPTRVGEDNSLLLKPGERKQVQVRVINTSDQTLTIHTSALDFIVDENGTVPVPVDNSDATNNRWSLASWLVLTPSEQVLSPRETGVVTVVIEVPEDALPGGHYAMVVHKPSFGKTEGTGNSAASGINQMLGTLLYVTVEGVIHEEAYVTNFTFPEFSEYGPVPYSFTVDNRSDIHITPQIGITIKNLFGKTVEAIPLESKNIFPFSTRSYEGQWNKIWGFGPYTATLTMSYGTQGQVIVSYTRFWLLPVRIILAVVVVILTLIAAGIAVRRHILHKRNDQAKRISELESQLQEVQANQQQPVEQQPPGQQ
jgi:hypothetical protein